MGDLVPEKNLRTYKRKVPKQYEHAVICSEDSEAVKAEIATNQQDLRKLSAVLLLIRNCFAVGKIGRYNHIDLRQNASIKNLCQRPMYQWKP